MLDWSISSRLPIVSHTPIRDLSSKLLWQELFCKLTCDFPVTQWISWQKEDVFFTGLRSSKDKRQACFISHDSSPNETQRNQSNQAPLESAKSHLLGKLASDTANSW